MRDRAFSLAWPLLRSRLRIHSPPSPAPSSGTSAPGALDGTAFSKRTQAPDSRASWLSTPSAPFTTAAGTLLVAMYAGRRRVADEERLLSNLRSATTSPGAKIKQPGALRKPAGPRASETPAREQHRLTRRAPTERDESWLRKRLGKQKRITDFIQGRGELTDIIQQVRDMDQPLAEELEKERRSFSAYRHSLFRRNALRKRGIEQWLPKKVISYDDMERLRELWKTDHAYWSVVRLSRQFRISIESVRRIIHSKFVPDPEKVQERKEKLLSKKKKALAELEHLTTVSRNQSRNAATVSAAGGLGQQRTGAPNLPDLPPAPSFQTSFTTDLFAKQKAKHESLLDSLVVTASSQSSLKSSAAVAGSGALASRVLERRPSTPEPREHVSSLQALRAANSGRSLLDGSKQLASLAKIEPLSKVTRPRKRKP